MNKITVGFLVVNQETISKLSELPLKACTADQSRKIRKLSKLIKEEITNFEETRNQYIVENGTETENGTWSIKDEEDVQKAEKWISDLLKVEAEIEVEPFLTYEDVKNISEHIELSIKDLDVLEGLGILEE